MKTCRPSLSRIALALLALTSTSLAPAGTVTWVGPQGGSWATAANWSGGVLPGVLDDVELGSFDTVVSTASAAARVTGSGTLFIGRGNAVSLTGDSTLGGLSVVAGNFSSTGQTRVTGALQWSGAISGSGTTRVEGPANIGKLAGSTPMLISGHTLILAGSTVHRSVFNDLQLHASSRLINEGAWVEKSSTSGIAGSGGGSRFDNLGSFTKTSVGSFDVPLGVRFTNTGTVNVNAGTLQLDGGLDNQGLINIASGAELNANFTNLANAGTLAGTGTVRTRAFLSNNGTLAPGGAGQVGTLSFIGSLANRGSLLVDLGRSSADLLAVSGVVNLGGTLQVNVLNGERLARGSQFTVMSWGSRATGTEFANLDFSQASGYRFATAYEANGLSVTVTGVPFTWTGAASGGTWDVVNNWNDGNDGLPQASDTVLLGSASTRIRSVMSVGDMSGTGSLAVEAGGHLRLGGTGSVGGLQMRSASQLTNTGRLVATGDSSWVGASLRGSGVTRIEGAFAIAGNDFDGTPTLVNGHTLELAGTTTYTGRRGLSVGDGATLVNQGSWVDQSPTNVTLGNFNGGSGRFVNQGTFTKASSTRTLIGEGTAMDFENTGTLNVDAGYLRLSSSRVSSTGTVRIAAGAELSLVSFNATLGGQVLNQGTLSLDGGVLTTAGDLTLQGSGLTRLKSSVNNSGLLTVEGNVDWTDGSLTGAGTTRMLGNVAFATGARHLRNGQTLEILGTVTQSGTGSLNTGGAARVLNRGNWVDAANGNVGLGNFGGGANSRFDNAGRFTKTSAFVTEIGNGLNFNNTGTLDIQAGTLRLSDNATLAAAGQVRVASGATLELARGQVTLSGALQNAGTLMLSGATLNVTDSATVQGAGQAVLRGTVQNTGQLLLAGATEWREAVLAGSGTTRIEGPLTISGSNGRGLIGGHTLALAGSTTQTGTGSINTGGGSRIVNLGTWTEAANGAAFIGNFSGGAASRFDNTGTYVKTSAFITDIGNGVVLNNTGHIQVQAGTLRLSETFTNQGLVEIAAGAELASTVTALANAGTLAGDGTVRTVGSFFSLANTGTLAAGGLNDAGTLRLIGGLTQQANGIVAIDLGGTAAGSFDLLSVSASASLAGTLAVNLLDGAHFNVGDSFTVMTWGQRLNNSQFANLDLSHAQGYTFAAEYGANSLTLRVMTAAPVPEPGSWALMAAGLVGLGALQRRRRKVQPTA